MLNFYGAKVKIKDRWWIKCKDKDKHWYNSKVYNNKDVYIETYFKHKSKPSDV